MSNLKNFIAYALTYARPTELFRRLLETFVGYIILPIAYIFPRSQKKWVFGTNVGFTDNAKYLYLYTREKAEVKAIWITNKTDILQMMRNMHLEVYHKWSILGLWHCLTAGKYIFTNHTNDIHFFTVGTAKKVELWHGVGIKGGDSGSEGKKRDEAIKSTINKIVAPHNYESFDMFLSTGPLMNEHFTKIFKLRDGVLFDNSYPRCNFLQQDIDNIEKHILKYEPAATQQLIEKIKQYKHVYLYMPTWRSDMRDNFLKEAGIDFHKLNQAMRDTDSLFLLKLHPAVRHHEDYSDFDSLLFLPTSMDIYPILPYTSVLITDYSSIYYDYILMPEKEVILFPFDYDQYIKTSKSLAFDFDSFTPGVRANTFDELLNLIVTNQNLAFPQRKKIIKLFWGDNYKEKADNSILYNKIKEL